MSESETEAVIIDADSTGTESKVPELRPAVEQLTPEKLASLQKMTNITRSCTRQLQAINEAMERVLAKQSTVEDLAQILEEFSSAKR